MEPYFLFSIEERHFALGLSRVERVFPAVAVTPLSDGPDIVLGIINLHGRIIPVVDLRRRLGYASRPIRLDDSLVIAHTAQTAHRHIAFFADTVKGIVEGQEGGITEADEVVPGLEYVKGVMQIGDNLVLIHDLDRLLSNDEQEKLARSLGEVAADGN